MFWRSILFAKNYDEKCLFRECFRGRLRYCCIISQKLFTKYKNLNYSLKKNLLLLGELTDSANFHLSGTNGSGKWN
jgi:hypothetical protein